MKKVIAGEEGLRGFAHEVMEGILSGARANQATVIALSGDLGAGKTAFTRALAHVLGIPEHVTSPTFVIQKIYKVSHEMEGASGFAHLIHIDAYRLDGAHELRAIGWDDILHDPKNLIVVEWPERVEGAVPKHALHMSFSFIDRDTREIAW